VVICTWDLRRLVVPIPYLLARPIENWTRSSSEILGTVELSVDHQVDMDALRAAAVEAAKASAHWDGKDPSVVVTNLTVGAVEVRIVVGAANTAALWDLRCEVRERMLRWLQRRRAAAPHG
jgi:small-conductance mechanosensitive channel